MFPFPFGDLRGYPEPVNADRDHDEQEPLDFVCTRPPSVSPCIRKGRFQLGRFDSDTDPGEESLGRVRSVSNSSRRLGQTGAPTLSDLPVRFPGVLGDCDKVLVAEVVDWSITTEPCFRR